MSKRNIFLFLFCLLCIISACLTWDKETPAPDIKKAPLLNKIVVIIGENTNASSVIGNTGDAPYINSLAASGANFTASFAIEHPSQPNYFDLFSGSNQGIVNNDKPISHFTTANLARELLDAGKNFFSYCEDLPFKGFDGELSDMYVRRHNPAANWMGTGANQIPASANQSFTDFPSNYSLLPDVTFIMPNLCHDGHDACPGLNNRVRQFDQWLKENIDSYRAWCLENNSLLIVTYDEDNFTTINQVATVFYGAHVKIGAYNKIINHFNVLRTIEDLMGLSTHAGQASSAASIDYCWQ